MHKSYPKGSLKVYKKIFLFPFDAFGFSRMLHSVGVLFHCFHTLLFIFIHKTCSMTLELDEVFSWTLQCVCACVCV